MDASFEKDYLELKRTMTYFPDLAPCTYFGIPGMVAIGWLTKGKPYTQGEVSPEFLEKLKFLRNNRLIDFHFMGFHKCEFCTEYSDSRELFVPASGFLYGAPAMILHYIEVHHYKPPEEFCLAVLECAKMNDRAYRHAIAVNWPEDSM